MRLIEHFYTRDTVTGVLRRLTTRINRRTLRLMREQAAQDNAASYARTATGALAGR